MTVKANNTATCVKFPVSAYCNHWDCIFQGIAARNPADALRILEDHQPNCPQRPKVSYMTDVLDENGQPYTLPNHGKSIAEKLWDTLDKMLASLQNKNGKHYQDIELKGKCQGLAYAIHQMQTDYYPTPDDVTRQAVKRGQIARGEIPYEQTPGYKYNPLPPDHKAYAAYQKTMTESGPRAAKASTPKTKQTASFKSLTPEEEHSIRAALDSGFIKADALAKSFKISVAQVEAIGSSA
jgi:hypothetical protein